MRIGSIIVHNSPNDPATGIIIKIIENSDEMFFNRDAVIWWLDDLSITYELKENFTVISF